MKNYYQKNYQDYHEKTFSIDPSSFLQPFVKRLPEGSKILDIGCGSGRDLLWLKNRGFNVMGFERSEGLAALARKNVGCEILEDDFTQYDFSLYSFDALALIGALVHVPQERLSEILSSIYQALKPGGHLTITLKEGDGLLKGTDGRTFTLWQCSQLEKIFFDLNLDILDFNRQVSKFNQSDIWLGYVLRKN